MRYQHVGGVIRSLAVSGSGSDQREQQLQQPVQREHNAENLQREMHSQQKTARIVCPSRHALAGSDETDPKKQLEQTEGDPRGRHGGEVSRVLASAVDANRIATGTVQALRVRRHGSLR